MESSESNIRKIKNCLTTIIPKEESIIEFATVKLSIYTPYEKKFLPFYNEGILSVTIKRNNYCLYLQLYELIEFKKVFEIELYTNISEGYTVFNPFFHSIEFPGFFLGISFAIPYVSEMSLRGDLIQKAIISTSKFISINLSDYIFYYKFDSKKIYQNISKKKNCSPRIAIKKKSRYSIKNYDNLGALSNYTLNSPKKEHTQTLNIIPKNEHKSIDGTIIGRRRSKSFAPEVLEKKLNNVSGDSNSSNSNESSNVNKVTNNNINNSEIIENNEDDEKSQFDNILIEDCEDNKIYKIVQYHLEKDKMKFIKKIYLKNFNRFIRSEPLFEKIKAYNNVNKFDFFEEDNESEEDENEKQFVDYVPNEMIGALDDQDDEMDEHIRELTEQRKKLKEIRQKKEDKLVRTTSVYSSHNNNNMIRHVSKIKDDFSEN